MIRRHHTVFLLSLMLADGVAAMATFMALSVVRSGAGWREAWAQAGYEPGILMITFAAAWVAVLGLGNLYRLRARWSLRREVLDVIRAGVLLAVVAFTALLVLKLPTVSRFFLLWLFPAQVVVTIASRFVLRWAFGVAQARGVNIRYVLMIGTSDFAQRLADSIERHRELGLRVIGHLALEGKLATESGMLPTAPPTRPVLGPLDAIEDVLHTRVVDEVVICLPLGAGSYVEAIAGIALDEGKIVRIPTIPGLARMPGGRQEEFDGIPMHSMVVGTERVLSLIVKRLLDIVLATIGLLVAAPLFVVITVLMLIFEGRPILFSQERVGLHGRRFRMLKFRSMVPDAEARLEALLGANEVSGPAFKLSNDPRLTKLGRWLRRTSLDELPQAWNVLKGDMSFVGPRPALPREVSDYDVWHRRRLSMKPGITGLWQVSARRDSEFERWVLLDLDYIDRWSFWLDLKILFRTVPAMIQGR